MSRSNSTARWERGIAVLRRGTPAKTAVYDGDEHPDTVHIGARADGVVVATSTWIRAAWQESPAAPAVQLRGMAVDDSLQGTGVGRKLIEAGIDHARTLGARFVWAKARDSALDFYLRCGFRVVGEQFMEPASGMPHHLDGCDCYGAKVTGVV
ncbi:MAG: GNAT family N-acetyltransferase [Actinobacteria bacterium]|nr:GNAT family N-acetyltransferase [Actinomycetota bacterium]